MSNTIEIQPVGALDARVRPPGSKSLTNRALVCAALADGTSELTGVLDSDDTRLMTAALQSLGVKISTDWESQVLQVVGCAGSIPNKDIDIDVGNSGTTIRFLTAICTLGHGEYRLNGLPRMRERPIADLADALNTIGSNVQTENGFPPVLVKGSGLRGGHLKIRADKSSQFVSGLLMALPFSEQFSVVQVDGDLVSKPYVDMTCQVMHHFGVSVTRLDELLEYSVDTRGGYDSFDFEIEPDASAASYFWAAAAIAGGSVTVEGLANHSIQGDVRFSELLEQMGCEVEETDVGIRVSGKALNGIDVDLNDISDTAQTLAAVALFVEGPTRIRGIAHNRNKETDRIGNLATELRKFGASVEEHDDGLTITPGPLSGALIETYDDHRMAMSMSLVGLSQPGVIISNPGCSAKTYPNFFEDLSGLQTAVT